MPINSKYKAEYSCGNFYHVFNRASGGQLLFKNEENYYFFLQRFGYYLNDLVILHSWCLIPNHFHFLIQVKKFKDISIEIAETDVNQLITKRFKNFFISYSMSFKRMHDQKSNVFSQKYKHVQLYTDADIKRVVLYIHKNPTHHNMEDWKTYKWSSYNDILHYSSKEKEPSFVLDLFEGRGVFLETHLDV